MESLAGPQYEYLATGWNYFCANLLGVFRRIYLHLVEAGGLEAADP